MKKKAREFKYPSRVEIFEVGPRDGLQSEKKIFSLAERFELVRLLAQSGVRRIEVGSFVKADRIPQLDGTDQLMANLRTLRFKPGQKPEFWAFIPNEFGLRKALECKVDGASFFVTGSETFSRKNVNRPVREVLAELKYLLPAVKKAKLPSRVYVSTIVYCPYEGPVSPVKVQRVVEQLVNYGAKEIVLSDTTGHANPRSLERLLLKVFEVADPSQIALHLHDTRGLALANVLEGLKHGIRIFDSSVGGLGGCPYAPGASGNLASEDLANMLLGMSVLKGIDLTKLALAAQFTEKVLGRQVPSKVLRTLIP